MNGITTVTTKGQVTVPGNLRKVMKISPGDKLYFESDLRNRAIKVKKISSKIVVEELAGSMYSAVKFIDLEIVRQKAGEMLGKKYKGR